jgi:hypothetical protein
MMRIEGFILPSIDEIPFDCDMWRQLISRRPELQLYPEKTGINPFTKNQMVIAPNPDHAMVILDGRSVGSAFWSMSEETLVCISIESSALPMVLEWAKELRGEFHRETLGLAE